MLRFALAQRSAACRYIDFIIGDAVVSPPDFQHGYTEKLLLMPYTFQVAPTFEMCQRVMLSGALQVTSHGDEHPHPWPGSRDEVYETDTNFSFPTS